MRKLKHTAIFLILLTGVCAAQPLHVDALEKDFGEMRPLEQRTLIFALKNLASDTLFLGQPKPSCGCTASFLANSVLAPGDSTQLSVQFHAAAGMNGSINKSVSLSGRVAGMETKLAVFRVHAEIIADVKFEPGMLRFNSVIGDTVVLEATLRSNTDKTVKLENITAVITAYVDTTEGNIYHVELVQSSSFTAFTLALESEMLEAGDSVKLAITLYPMKKGQINGTIRIPLSDTELRIPVVGTVLRQRE
ncbi:MAG: DUF1573 domain-containing protein [Bacteroidota bacterium]